MTELELSAALQVAAKRLIEAEGADGAARDAADRALGMAALVSRGDGSAELKRTFVRDDARGQGLAGRLLDRIEMDAATSGIQHIELETGPLQYAALALYERRGYARIPNFGPYVGDEFSVCFAKELLTRT